MSYTVLARKWRPQTFEEVIGQDHVIRTLQNALSSSRIAHAYIFTGIRGVGKTTVARILAKSLNCEKGPSSNPCNTCASCEEITKGSSMDVMEIDGASNTGVDDIREIREGVSYLPSRGRYRIYIIDEVHMLSTNAFNALLKTLEEPPPHVIFIFATTEPHKIPLTILSRCQRFDFRRIPAGTIVKHLRGIVDAEGVEVSDRTLMIIAEEADGSMRDAQSILDQIISSRGKRIEEGDVVETLGLLDKSIIHEIVGAIIKKDGLGCIKVIEKVYEFGYDEKRFWHDIIRVFRDLIILKSLSGEQGSAGGGKGVGDALELIGISGEEAEYYLDIIKTQGIDDLHYITQSLIKGFEEFGRSPYPRLALEVTLLKIVNLPKIYSIDQLLTRLDSIETSASRVQPATYGRGLAEGLEPVQVKDEGLNGYGGGDVEEGDEDEGTEDSAPDTTSDDIREGFDWDSFVAFVRARRPPLSSHLEYARPISIEGGVVRIGVKEGIHYDYLSDMENLLHIEGLCKDFLKRDVSIRFDRIDMVEDAVAKVEAIPAGGEDKFVKDVIDIFDGKVYEIIDGKEKIGR